MYVIAMKNRPNEIAAMKELQSAGLLRPDILPLVEIIHEKYEYDKLRDPITGKYITEKRLCNDDKIRNYKIDDPSSKRDITLQSICNLFPNRTVLVDYFRFEHSKYKFDPSKIELVLRLNRSVELYCQKVKAIKAYPLLVPVITVKRSMDDVLNANQVLSLVQEIRETDPNHHIAIRIDDIEGYEQVLQRFLHQDDYLIYDFNEQPFRSKPIECKDLADLGLTAHTVALCSPRKRDTTGKDYPNGEVATLIDNSHLDLYKHYGFSDVGDYGGLKDNLPSEGSYRGRALALMYMGTTNSFKSFVNTNAELGQRGYPAVVARILADNDFTDDSECLVLKAITTKLQNGTGFSFAEWVKYTLIRYIQQLATKRPLFD